MAKAKRVLSTPRTTASKIPLLTAQQSEPENAEYPVSTFGKLPAGFTLERQSVYVLAQWHSKALKAISELTDDADADETEVDAACKLARDILEAILVAETHTSREVAVQLAAAVETIDHEKSVIEEVLDVDDLRRLTTNLAKATAPLRPTKRVGALQRGRKLTRAGLLHRYHAFLFEELETIGVNLYGNRDHPLRTVSFDDAVNLRCKSPRYSLFDERKLPARARAVLKSLKIDTENGDVGVGRGRVNK
jgi:hypothetical protein